MRISVNLLSQHTATRPQHELYREMLEQAEAADALGFDSLFVNEHHPFRDPQLLWLQPLMALAGLATRTRRIRLGTNILVLPLYHPIRIAEDAAMINAMSGGRLVLGVAIGFVPEEFSAFGVPIDKRVGVLTEQIEILRALWTRPGVTYEGRHFQLADISLPFQTLPPPPPIWIGAEVDRAVARAARLGDAWLPADTSSIPLLRESYALYREALEAAGKRFEDIERPLMRESFVAERSQDAEAILSENVVAKYRHYWGIGAPQLREEFPSGHFDFDGLKTDRFVVGSPEQCVEQMMRHRDELGVDHLILRLQKPGIEHRKVMKALELIGDRVLPHFRAARDGDAGSAAPRTSEGREA